MNVTLENGQILIKNTGGQIKHTQSIIDYVRDLVGSTDEFPSIMIFTPVKNRGWIMQDFLKHIYDLDYPKDKIRCVFVVNDSLDDTELILRRWEEEHKEEYNSIEVLNYDIRAPIDKRNLRKTNSYYSYFAVIRNHGLHQLKNEDYIFSCDSDILVRPETLKKLVSHKKDIVASLIPNNKSGTLYNILDWRDLNNATHIRSFPRNELISVGFTGACYLIDSRVIKAGVRYGYHPQGEDGYFCRMALQRGFKIYADTGLKQEHKMRTTDY